MSLDNAENSFSRNEESINITLSKALLLAVSVYPILIICCITGIFLSFDLIKLIILSIFIIFASVANYFFCKKHSSSTLIKYFCLTIAEITVFFISILKGFSPFISYILTPLISCLYFDEKFSLKVSFACFVIMILSLAYRAVFQLPMLNKGLTPLKWFLAFGVGGTIEFFIYSLFIYFLTKTARSALSKMYLRKSRSQRLQNQIIQGFANIVESKDATTGQHILRTSEYVRLICNKLLEKNIYTKDLTQHKIELMVRAAPFHDLGKISVPDYILNKTGKLTKEEFHTIQRHPTDGAKFIIDNLSGIEDEELILTACNMTLCHHEKLDGTGYPFHLMGEEIPIEARIMSAADILDALMSKRSYKETFSTEQTLSIIKGMAGTALDANIVNVLCESKNEIEKIMSHGKIYDEK